MILWSILLNLFPNGFMLLLVSCVPLNSHLIWLHSCVLTSGFILHFLFGFVIMILLSFYCPHCNTMLLVNVSYYCIYVSSTIHSIPNRCPLDANGYIGKTFISNCRQCHKTHYTHTFDALFDSLPFCFFILPSP